MQIKTVFAIEACLSNDSVAVVLDPSITIPNNNYTYNYLLASWGVNASYGTFSGTSACLSTNYGLGDLKAYTENGGVLVDNGTIVTGGEDHGLYCWCKMLHPAVSLWVFRTKDNQDLSHCLRYCSDYCAHGLQLWENFRSVIFGAVMN